MPHVHVTTPPPAPTSVIEVNGTQPFPEFLGQPAQDYANVVGRQVMNSSEVRVGLKENLIRPILDWRLVIFTARIANCHVFAASSR